MTESISSTRLIPVANLREFFRDALQSAFAKQHLSVEDQTEHYVVNLLTLFARSEALYERTPSGTRLKPLAVMLSEALEAPSAQDRHRGLQRLGDVSLFIAGFFAQSFAQARRHRLPHRHGRPRLWHARRGARPRSAARAGRGVRRARAKISAAGRCTERAGGNGLPSFGSRHPAALRD